MRRPVRRGRLRSHWPLAFRGDAGNGWSPLSFYDELGVPPSATADEIRQAYRELVRLLHPDQYQDETLRRAAERQLRRLNHVVAVLTDPVERRRYNLSLKRQHAVAREGIGAFAQAAAHAVSRPVWVAAAALAVALVVPWFLWNNTRTEVHLPPPAGSPVIDQLGLSSVPLQPRAPVSNRSTAEQLGAPRPLHRLPARTMEGPLQITPHVMSWALHQVAGGDVAGEPAEKADVELGIFHSGAASQTTGLARAPADAQDASAPAPTFSLAGTWLYVPDPVVQRREGVYPPEYVELRLIEDRGMTAGRYRARYRVSNVTLWPEVQFEFAGPSGKEIYEWRGGGGAQGEVRLRQVADGKLEVTWWAHRLGERLSLASGAVVLVQERAPGKGHP